MARVKHRYEKGRCRTERGVKCAEAYYMKMREAEYKNYCEGHTMFCKYEHRERYLREHPEVEYNNNIKLMAFEYVMVGAVAFIVATCNDMLIAGVVAFAVAAFAAIRKTGVMYARPKERPVGFRRKTVYRVKGKKVENDEGEWVEFDADKFYR